MEILRAGANLDTSPAVRGRVPADGPDAGSALRSAIEPGMECHVPRPAGSKYAAFPRAYQCQARPALLPILPIHSIRGEMFRVDFIAAELPDIMG